MQVMMMQLTTKFQRKVFRRQELIQTAVVCPMHVELYSVRKYIHQHSDCYRMANVDTDQCLGQSHSQAPLKLVKLQEWY